MYLFTSINCLSVSPCVFVLERERERERERAMLQSYSFVLPLKSSVQDQGSVTQIQLPVRQIQSIAYNPSFKKRFRCRCFRYFSNSDLNATRSESKTTTEFLESFSEDEFPSKMQEDDHPGTIQSDICRQLNAFYRFSRPHTVIGTLIGITSVSLLPLESTADFSIRFLVGLLKALVPSVLMNIYVVGLNQLFDVRIDKVNKPYLPLASGEFSMEVGMAIVSTFLLMSFTLGIMFQSPPLLCALIVSFLLGSAYSVELPLLRWKRNAFLAATCILIVRAIVVQLAFFIHIQKYVLDRPIVLSRSLAFAVAFMCLFSTIIALFKDIPDVDGDRDYGIQSFSVSLGQKKVFWLCISMLLIGYGSAVVIGASSSYLSSKLVTVLGHCALASSLWLRARSVDLDSKASITSLYMFIWKLFYAEYLLIPFVR